MKKWLAIIALFLSISGYAQLKPEVSAKLSVNYLKIGEQTVLTISFQGSSNDSVTWFDVADTLSTHIEVVQAQKTDTIYDSTDISKKQIRQKIVLTSFDSGIHVIKPFVIYVNNIPYETEALLLEVTNVAVDTTKEIYDIKPPIDVDYSWIEWLKDNWRPVLGIAIIIAIFVGFGIWYYRDLKSRSNEPEYVAPAPKIPAHIRALEKLQQVKDEKLWQNGQYKRYHSDISDVLRQYLEDTYHIQALEQTTFEMMRSLRHAAIPEASLHKLKQILSLADLVKFAKEEPLPQENEASMEGAIYFIQQTVSLKDDENHA